MKRQLVGLALVSIAALALADQTAQTTPETYVSAFGRYRLTVFPMEEQGTFWTHAELMVIPTSSDQRAQTISEATLERWVGNRYELIWRRPLVNKISPESALVSSIDGSFATFDDWGNTGYGDNVVVIYTSEGEVVKKLALNDLLTKEEIKKLPHTVSSIQWRGQHILLNGDRVLELRVRTNEDSDGRKPEYRNVQIRMADGTLVD